MLDCMPWWTAIMVLIAALIGPVLGVIHYNYWCRKTRNKIRELFTEAGEDIDRAYGIAHEEVARVYAAHEKRVAALYAETTPRSRLLEL